MVWGLRGGDNRLVLVQKDSTHKLIFDNMPPSSLAFPVLKTMKFAPSNFPGRAIVLSENTETKQFLAFGYADSPKAMTILADGDHIIDANLTWSALHTIDAN